jgi:3-methyladenine DNA glycosylase/8-oxoguanine DNA glycosylase
MSFSIAPRCASATILEPDDGRLLEIAEAWRPYRSWVCLLLRASD